MICGRIINLATDDGNFTPDSVGLLNLGDDNSSTQIFKLKLNLSETKEFALFEGEVVVCEGFSDTNSRFNVNRIHKPPTLKLNNLYDFKFLQKCQEMQKAAI